MRHIYNIIPIITIGVFYFLLILPFVRRVYKGSAQKLLDNLKYIEDKIFFKYFIYDIASTCIYLFLINNFYGPFNIFL